MPWMQHCDPRKPFRVRRRRWMEALCVSAFVLYGCGPASPTSPTAMFNVLVFSKTAGYRHSSIPAGQQAIQALGRENDFGVVLTEDPAVFSEQGLANFAVVVFLNTTGDVLNEQQQGALEQFIRGGHGFVGVHAAADTEYEWPWYGGLMGAYFNGHPDIQPARIRTVDHEHPSTRFLPATWEFTEEWYSFKSVQPGLHRLLQLDETSYNLGSAPAMGEDHPLAWFHPYDGGRSWYTGLGHREETFADQPFRRHLLGGLLWASGRP